MTTNHSKESDDEFRLDASLQSFEKSLRQHEPRRVELDVMQLSNGRSRWSNKRVTLSPLSLAISCGGSALAGAAVVLLIINTSFNATVIDPSSKQPAEPSVNVQLAPVPSPSLTRHVAMTDYVDVEKLSVGKLLTHPELAQLPWRPLEGLSDEAIDRSDTQSSSGMANASNLKPNSSNTLFNLNRELQ